VPGLGRFETELSPDAISSGDFHYLPEKRLEQKPHIFRMIYAYFSCACRTGVIVSIGCMFSMEFLLNPQKMTNYVKNLALVGAFSWIGFLTLIIALGALLAGMWLDAQWGTKPVFTVGLLILSIPINIFLQFRAALNVAKQIQSGMPAPQSDTQKDE
jgi:hypothetical protein